MTPKHLCTLVLALVAISGAVAQSDDIPIENDNQFPPENPSISEGDGDAIHGSGDGAVEEPLTAQAEATSAPQLEEVQPTTILSETTTSQDQSCPSPCVCHYEGGSDNFIVNCAGYQLEELPSPIDYKTTVLYLQNNKLSDIPKDVSSLKNLKVLNAENNSIMNLALGSVSELPELKVLKLGNNRLIEYPQDLKNSISLSKLEELDLGGNDIRTELLPETFSNFIVLRKLTLATSNPDLLQDLCISLKSSLEMVCTESCEKSFYECTGTPSNVELVDDDLIEATYPGMIPFEGENENSDRVVQSHVADASGVEKPVVSSDNSDKEDTTEENILINKSPASGRALINNTPEETVPQKSDNIVETPKEETAKTDDDVKIGAATTSTNTGGVSRSVIGIIVASMIVVVAAITIKKNWSSIRKRFSSTSRPAERGGANANGTTPEEVPLQEKDKSPV